MGAIADCFFTARRHSSEFMGSCGSSTKDPVVAADVRLEAEPAREEAVEPAACDEGGSFAEIAPAEDVSLRAAIQAGDAARVQELLVAQPELAAFFESSGDEDRTFAQPLVPPSKVPDGPRQLLKTRA